MSTFFPVLSHFFYSLSILIWLINSSLGQYPFASHAFPNELSRRNPASDGGSGSVNSFGKRQIAQPIAIYAQEDTFIRGTAPFSSVNYNNAPHQLLISDSKSEVALLKFPVSGQSGHTKVELQLHPLEVSDKTAYTRVRVDIVSNSWDEATVTWDNQPVSWGSITAFDVEYGQTHLIDVTPFIGSTFFSIRLTMISSTGYVQYAHSESGKSVAHPKLLFYRTDTPNDLQPFELTVSSSQLEVAAMEPGQQMSLSNGESIVFDSLGHSVQKTTSRTRTIWKSDSVFRKYYSVENEINQFSLVAVELFLSCTGSNFPPVTLNFYDESDQLWTTLEVNFPATACSPRLWRIEISDPTIYGTVFLPSIGYLELSSEETILWSYTVLFDGSSSFSARGLNGEGDDFEMALKATSLQSPSTMTPEPPFPTNGTGYPELLPQPVYVGCFKDHPVDRDLPSLHIEPFLDHFLCFETCISERFLFAGVQVTNGTAYCFCGDLFGRYGIAEEPCEEQCPGDDTQICGGYLKNSIFQLTVKAPAEQWVMEVLSFSSEDSPNYNASSLIGATDVYPQYGDLVGSWAPNPDVSTNSTQSKRELSPLNTTNSEDNCLRQSYPYFEYLDVRFPVATRVSELQIFETFNPGGTYQILTRQNESYPWVEVWSDPFFSNYIDNATARVFNPPLIPAPFPSNEFRIVIDVSNSIPEKRRYMVDAIKAIDLLDFRCPLVCENDGTLNTSAWNIVQQDPNAPVSTPLCFCECPIGCLNGGRLSPTCGCECSGPYLGPYCEFDSRFISIPEAVAATGAALNFAQYEADLEAFEWELNYRLLIRNLSVRIEDASNGTIEIPTNNTQWENPRYGFDEVITEWVTGIDRYFPQITYGRPSEDNRYNFKIKKYFYPTYYEWGPCENATDCEQANLLPSANFV